MDLIVREPAVAAVGSVSGRRSFEQFVRDDRVHSLANPATATSAPYLYWSGAQRRCPSRATGPVVMAFCRCWFAWWGRPRPRGEPLRSEHFPPGLMVQERPAPVIGRGDQRRIFHQLLFERRGHVHAHWVLLGVGRLPTEPTFQQPASHARLGTHANFARVAEVQPPGGIVLLALLRLHSGSHQVDRVTAEHDSADAVYPIANLVERYAGGISLLDGPHPVRGIDQCAADQLAIEVDVGEPHVLTARSVVGILPLPIGEGCLDAGQVQARDDPPPLPSHFS